MPGHHNQPKCTDEEFIALWRKLQSVSAVAHVLLCSERGASARRRRIEARYGIHLPVSDPRAAYNTAEVKQRAIVSLSVKDGTVIVFSDAHVWPGPMTTMMRATIKLTKELRPFAVIANGDMFDGATVSRHARIGWERRPSVQEELEAVGDFLGSVKAACPKAKRVWNAGNHDTRFESKIANGLPEFAKVTGVHLKDHFPDWLAAWRTDINDDVVVRHRELGGEHADFRNTVTTGKTIVTGHDHRANVTAYTTYGGTRWGVRCGYLAEDALDEQFVHYLEARAPNWQPAFAVLTFRDGVLLWPELCTRHAENVVAFRGELIEV